MSDWLSRTSSQQNAGHLPEDASAIVRAMLRRSGEHHDAARRALIDDDFEAALGSAREEWFMPWSHFVQMTVAWVQGHPMRAWSLLSRSTHLVATSPADAHYLAELAKVKEPLKRALLAAEPQGSVTACIIAKNEERALQRCIESVKGVASKVIVLDTGSSDRTLEIAASCGAETAETVWRDDFAAARNEVLALADTEWVLSIDADEWLDPASIVPLKIAIADLGCIYSAMHMSVGLPRHVSNPRLLVREGARWEGRIHENIRYDARAPTPITYEPFILRHDGYSEVVDQEAKRRRDRRIIEKIAETDPDYGAVLGVNQDWKEGDRSPELLSRMAEVAEKHAAPGVLFSNKLFMLLAGELLRLNELERAVAIANMAEQKGLAGMWSCHVLAHDALARGAREEARGLAQRGIAYNELNGDVARMRADLRRILTG